jgi:hypothetical protein
VGTHYISGHGLDASALTRVKITLPDAPWSADSQRPSSRFSSTMRAGEAAGRRKTTNADSRSASGTDRGVDAKRIAITGVSRLGQTVMWAGAADPQIAAVIASCSGEGGAALSRRNYGETIAHLVAPTRYAYQFARNYAKWVADPNTSPIDANLLVALIAPRALLLETGDTDAWSDPKGEFLSAVSAKPVFELFGKHGPASDAFPPAGQIVGDTLSYYMHAGGHGMGPGDWGVFLDFLERQFKLAPGGAR